MDLKEREGRAERDCFGWHRGIKLEKKKKRESRSLCWCHNLSYSCINFLTLPLLLPRRVKVPTKYQLSLRPPNLDRYMMSRAL